MLIESHLNSFTKNQTYPIDVRAYVWILLNFVKYCVKNL